MVTLTGYIIVPENELEAVKSELPVHIALTRDEPGCISFDVVQSDSNPCRFDVAENFESRSAFEAHQTRVKDSHWGKVTVNVERHYEITEQDED